MTTSAPPRPSRGPVLTDPVRRPDEGDQALMTKRAIVLVVLNLLVPGGAQVVAGNRRLGRFGLVTTLVLWGLVVVTALVAFFARTLLVTFATNWFALLLVQIAIVFYGLTWLVLTVDTLRLARVIRAAPRVRAVVAGFSALSLVLIVVTGGWGLSTTSALQRLLGDVFSGGQVAEPIDGRYNVMLLGADAGPDRMGLRPDSISVASIDAETGAVVMIGVPRNLYDAPFSEGSPMLGEFADGRFSCTECMINGLYTYGMEHPELYPDAVANGSDPGIEATRDGVEGVTGLTMQYYALINMQGFANLVDALGGVTITVESRLPIGGDDQLNGVEEWIEPGEQHLDGFHALWYGRSRHTDNDYARMERQRNLQRAILQQVDPQTILTRFNQVADAGSELVETDIPGGMLSTFVDLAELARSQQFVDVELTPENGVELGAEDYDLTRRMVADAIAAQGATGEPAAQ